MISSHKWPIENLIVKQFWKIDLLLISFKKEYFIVPCIFYKKMAKSQQNLGQKIDSYLPQ
jgi:hypothetical protein